MKKLSKSKYYGPISIILLTIGYYAFYYATLKEPPTNSSSYKLFHIVSSNKAYIHSGKGRSVKFNYQLLDDVSRYRQQFVFKTTFDDLKSKVAVSVLNNIRKNDTLLIGVLKSDFQKIQNYSYNFIKNDFFDRALEIYWLKKKDRILINPQLWFEAKKESDFQFSIMLVIASAGAIIRIAYLIGQKVKFFT